MNRTIAVIMAGGKGTRLLPITSELPKPLAPLLGKPALFYILDLLEQYNFKKAVITLGYMGERIRTAVLNERENIIDIDFSFEQTPLGTAGGVLKALEGLREYDNILVISGDAVCDFDLVAAVKQHGQRKAVATIIGKCVSDPREYGLIYCSQGTSERIEEFIEKPSYHNCCTDLASTGVYILSKEILSCIKPNTFCDFAKDVFPKLMKDGKSIYSYKEDGYWCDIGDIKSYMQCQRDILNGLVQCRVSDAVESESTARCREAGCDNSQMDRTRQPRYIGRNTYIAESAQLVGSCVIGDNVSIGENCVVKDSVLLNGVYVGESSSIIDSVCCEGAKIESGAVVSDGSAIGAYAVIKQGARVLDGARVWQGKTVSEGHTLREDLRLGSGSDIIVDEYGISGQINVKITPLLCTKIGSGVASLKKNANIGVGFSGNQASAALYHAVAAGIVSSGAQVWSFGECIQSQFAFCVNKCLVDYGIYIDGGSFSTIRVFEKGGLPTTRSTERSLEAAINRSEYLTVPPKQMGTVVSMTSLNELYQIELVKMCNEFLSGVEVSVKSRSSKITEILSKTLDRLGCESSDRLTIVVSENGEQVCWRLDSKPYLCHEQILALVCYSDLIKGESIAISQIAPMIIDEIAKQTSGSVLRYCDCSCDEKDRLARQAAVNNLHLRDGLMLSVKLLSFMKEKGYTYSELQALIPEFFTSSRLVALTVPPSVLLKQLKCEKTPELEGVRLHKNGMSALIRPLKSGKGLMIFSESVKSETAVEICDVFEDIINSSQ